mmetsp:Transcript_82765/g.146154  ORF Transcript_82765/g.146154 Transcript_82765/m.146154 type:complete len:207 (+) Transcript_82765:279-899(+)
MRTAFATSGMPCCTSIERERLPRRRAFTFGTQVPPPQWTSTVLISTGLSKARLSSAAPLLKLLRGKNSAPRAVSQTISQELSSFLSRRFVRLKPRLVAGPPPTRLEAILPVTTLPLRRMLKLSISPAGEGFEVSPEGPLKLSAGGCLFASRAVTRCEVCKGCEARTGPCQMPSNFTGPCRCKSSPACLCASHATLSMCANMATPNM